ncbi:MAG: proprotein convertase P-domain-containing protein, partial [Phycisphaerae bacterium]
GECIEDEPIQCDISFVLPDDAMLECPADTDPSATGMPTPVTGDCPGAEFSFQDVETAGCGNTTQIERVWTYEDDCDNSEDQSQMISVTDSTPPTIACEASTMIAELDEACEASFTFTATGTDACCDGPDGWFDGTGFVGNNLSSVNVSCNQQIPGIMQSVTVNETPGTAIPDDDASGLTRVLNVTESFQIADVRLGIQVTHTWVGDLCITLEHAGTTITVIQRLGDPALGCDADGCCACDVDNLVATFDDAASTSIDAIPCVDGETSGTFIPRELLAAFDGLDSAGDWTLTVSDNAAADTGSLASWGLTIDGVGADPNAEADYGLICDVSVDELADCPADATFDFKFEDCCGNESDVCQVTVDVQDNILPEVMCPEPLVLDRGDSVCGNVGILIEDWFNEFQATDNCDSDLTLSNDAPPCGFAAGTTTVTFSAEDDCGNVQTCTSTVTVDPPRRADASTKGSLLAFPNIELKWEPVPGGGFQLTQDTILSVTNDFNEYVDVHFLFVNGDDDLDELLAGDPPIVVERAHAGWNKYNWTTTLTANQSMYYSMAASPSNGIPPFIGLDNGPEGPGRPDPESANGGRYLRGYAIAWAVDNEGAEIKWDHLEGIATIVHYADHDAWEYQAIAYAGAPCFGHGSPLFDCLDRDDAGTCCSATEIPGQLDFDGFQYAANYNTLLLDFFASGSVPFGGNGVSAMIDTDLSLLPMVQDLRQNNDGPITVKADVDIWNQNEDFFSGTERCVSCWDQVLLSNFSDINNFIISQLGTDKGKARIDGIYSEQCQAGFCCERDDEQCIEDYEFANLGFPVPICSESAPLVGVAVKHIAYSGADSATAYAGSNLRGQGVDVNGQVLADLPSAPQPSNDTVDNDVLDNGEGERSDLIRDDAMRNGRKSLRNR